jgi:hypothetical protein
MYTQITVQDAYEHWTSHSEQIYIIKGQEYIPVERIQPLPVNGHGATYQLDLADDTTVVQAPTDKIWLYSSQPGYQTPAEELAYLWCLVAGSEVDFLSAAEGLNFYDRSAMERYETALEKRNHSALLLSEFVYKYRNHIPQIGEVSTSSQAVT